MHNTERWDADIKKKKTSSEIERHGVLLLKYTFFLLFLFFIELSDFRQQKLSLSNGMMINEHIVAIIGVESST